MTGDVLKFFGRFVEGGFFPKQSTNVREYCQLESVDSALAW